MRHPALLVTGIALVAVGLLGVAWLEFAARPSRDAGYAPRAPQSDYGPRMGRPGRLDNVELGERIYRYGVGEDGETVPRTAVGPGMMGAGCSACHGEDGRGGRVRMMMFDFRPPDIRLDKLLAGEEGEPWTRDDIGRAITEGVEPNGDRLDELMPRWELSEPELEAVIDHLGELSRR